MLKTQADQLIALLILAALFGGGGVAYGLANLVVQLGALLLLARNFNAVRDFFGAGPRLLVALVIASLALPLLQLVPLPPSIWTALPGREQVSQSLAAAGGLQWYSSTINQARTFVAFLGLIPPLAIIILGWRSENEGLYRAAPVIIAIGLCNVALGVVQVLGSEGTGILYLENEMPGVLFGFFANRNSTGLFLVCCLLVLVALPTARATSLARLTKAVAGFLLMLSVILTQSRTAIVLLGLPVAFAVLRLVSARLGKSRLTSPAAARAFFITGIAAVALTSLTPLIGNSRIGTALARFDASEDQRSLIWEDAYYAAQRFWPVGAGMATFDEVFQTDESLEHISPRRAGRAHNDYLEIAIEAGAIGLALLVAWAMWIALASWQAISTPRRWPALAGTGILLAIAIQSVFDYPLRNQSMLCMAAFAIVLIAPHGRRKPSDVAIAPETLS